MAAKTDALFAELAAQAKEGEHEKALATAEKILQALPTDADALASKLTCLIHLGRFEDVLKFTENKSELQFERAYAHYRLKNLSEALRIVRSLPKSQKNQTLEAQILYRLEMFDASSVLFQELYAKNNNAELRANLLASLVAQGAVKEALSLAASSKENTYEFTYNIACAQIEAGNLPAAIEALNAAEKICRANLSGEGVSEEEMHDEMAVIYVQKACVLQMMAKEEEALKIYSETLARKPSDAVVAAVAANNVVTLRHDHDLFDSLKKVKGATTPATEGKLSTAQKKAIHINHCLVLLKMNKADQCKELVQTLRTQMPQSYLPTVIEASMFFKDKKNPTKSEELLAAYASAHPKDSDYVQMCLAQIAFARDDIKGAATALSRVASLQHRPAMVATLAKLYTQVGDVTAANAVFDAAVAYWLSKSSSSSDDAAVYRVMVQESANFKMANRLYAEATTLLSNLLRIKGTVEADVLPQLVLAASHVDPEVAETYARRLPAFARAPVDAAALENAPSYRLGAPVKEEAATAAPSAAQKVAEEKQKKKRKRKKRLPKNFDPNKAPDPERWLPKSERYASRKAKKKGAALRGPQGAAGVSAAEGSKDASLAKEAPGAKPAAPSGADAPGSKPAAPHAKGGKGKAEAKPVAAPSSPAPVPAKPEAAPASPQGGKRKGKK